MDKDWFGNLKSVFTTLGASFARCYAWFVWVKGYSGSTNFKWFN